MTPEEIAALKAGDELTFKVEKVAGRIGDGVGVCFTGSRTRYFFALEELAHVTRTPAPEPPLAIGEPVMFDGERWEVEAPPRRSKGGPKVVLWRESCGYRTALASQCTRVQP